MKNIKKMFLFAMLGLFLTISNASAEEKGGANSATTAANAATSDNLLEYMDFLKTSIEALPKEAMESLQEGKCPLSNPKDYCKDGSKGLCLLSCSDCSKCSTLCAGSKDCKYCDYCSACCQPLKDACCS
jgi:hypothetical protein